MWLLRNDSRLTHPLKARCVSPHRINALIEADISCGAEIVLSVKVKDGHDEVQEWPREVLHDALFEAMLLGDRVPRILVLLDKFLDRIGFGARGRSLKIEEGADARPFLFPCHGREDVVASKPQA